LEGRFKPYAELGTLELVFVPHLGADGTFDEAIRGVAAIVHVAYVTKIVPDLNHVITPMVSAIRSIMNAAMREPAVKEVLFTSSGIAASPLARGIDNARIG
jgi:hypothetical protein